MTGAATAARAARTPRRLGQARLGVLTLFASLGVFAGNFFSRIPSLRDILGLDPSGIALLLLSGALGALASASFTGWLARRWGNRRLLWAANGVYLAAGVSVFATLGAASRVGFALSWFALVMAFAVVNVVMNAVGAEVERAAGSAIMSQFHASFAVALAAGVGMATLASRASVPLTWHLLAATALVTLMRALAINAATSLNGDRRDPAVEADRRGPLAVARDEYRDRRVLVLGAVAFTGSMIELSAGEWTALSVVDDYRQPEHVGTLVYGAFVVAMVAMRIAGPSVVGRLGRVATVRWSAVAAAVGVAIFAFAPTPALLPLATASWGLGAAMVIPVMFSAAADDPVRSASTVTAVTSFATASNMASPQLVGLLAHAVPLRHALLLLVVAGAIVYAAATSVAERGGRSP